METQSSFITPELRKRLQEQHLRRGVANRAAALVQSGSSSSSSSSAAAAAAAAAEDEAAAAAASAAKSKLALQDKTRESFKNHIQNILHTKANGDDDGSSGGGGAAAATKSAPPDSLWVRMGLGGGVDNQHGTMRGCCILTLIVTVVIVVLSLIVLGAMWFTTYDRLNVYRYTITATEHRVLPHVNDSALIEPPPRILGEVDLDYVQFELRWRFLDALGGGLPSPVASLDIRGPLDGKHPEVAPVVIGLGLGKKHGYFAGIIDIEGELATQIVRRANLYYVSLSDTTGREIARDNMDKMIMVNI